MITMITMITMIGGRCSYTRRPINRARTPCWLRWGYYFSAAHCTSIFITCSNRRFPNSWFIHHLKFDIVRWGCLSGWPLYGQPFSCLDEESFVFLSVYWFQMGEPMCNKIHLRFCWWCWWAKGCRVPGPRIAQRGQIPNSWRWMSQVWTFGVVGLDQKSAMQITKAYPFTGWREGEQP